METEYLNAYDPQGKILKTAGRKALLNEIKAYSLQYGDAPYAVDW
jgi:hypothetical protein